MGKRIVTLMLMAAVVLVACGKEGEPQAGGTPSEGQQGDCSPAPSALAQLPTLPPKFPVPDELVLTSTKLAGPSTIVEGYWESDLTDVYNEFLAAFPDAGYEVTFNENEKTDAEVNFAGGNTTGQVKLEAECEGRTHVKITIRPA